MVKGRVPSVGADVFTFQRPTSPEAGYISPTDERSVTSSLLSILPPRSSASPEHSSNDSSHNPRHSSYSFVRSQASWSPPILGSKLVPAAAATSTMAATAAATAATTSSMAGSSLRPLSGSKLSRCNPAAAKPSTGASAGPRLRVRADGKPGGPVKQAQQAADSTKVPITRDAVLAHQEADESEKRSVVGTVPRSGGTFPRAEVDRRPETGDASLASQMAFDGAGPETINGRLAMAGFLWAVVAEVSTHQSVMDQVSAPDSRGLVYFLGLAQLVTYASLVPILRGESPDSRRWGPFNAKAERWNGRLAMIGFAGLLVAEAAAGGALIQAGVPLIQAGVPLA